MHALNLHNGHFFRQIFRRKIWNFIYGVVVEHHGTTLSREIEVGLKRKYLNLFLFRYRWSVNENSK